MAVPLASLRSLDPEAYQRLLRELSRDETHRIDVFCRDTVRALERLQTACKERGVKVLVDATAQEAAKRKLPVTFALYSDDLTGPEWVQLLQHLGAADQRAEDKRAGDGVFDQLVPMPLTGTDQKELAAWLGVDLVQTAPPKAATGRPGRVKNALLVPYSPINPLRPSPGSKEVKQYLDGRGERASGAVAVLLVLRLPSP
jgi:hypothetical protein